MGRKNWSCTTCGLSTSRKSSIKRHNDNLHQGEGTIVTYEEHFTGVKSGRFPPPTYGYDRILPRLKNSTIGVSSSSVSYSDLRDNSWRHKFRTIFSNLLSDAAKKSNTNAVLTPSGNGRLLFINYFGFVCPTCLTIGITGISQTAEDCSRGKHACNLAGFESFAGLAKDKKDPMIERLRKQELVFLLYDAIKAIAQKRSLVLTGHSMYPNYKGYFYNLFKPRDVLLDRLILNQSGSFELADKELSVFLSQYKRTSISLTLLDDYDLQFTYDLKLAIMNSY